MAFNKKGRFYEKGKCLSEELKGQIVDKILETGGDRFPGYSPGKPTELGDKFGVSGKTAKSVWQKFVHDGTVSPKKRISGNPPKLSTGDLQLIETMKTMHIVQKHHRTTSTTWKFPKWYFNQQNKPRN